MKKKLPSLSRKMKKLKRLQLIRFKDLKKSYKDSRLLTKNARKRGKIMNNLSLNSMRFRFSSTWLEPIFLLWFK